MTADRPTNPLSERQACPACEDRTPGQRVGHTDRDVFDGVLFWSCLRCGYAWPRAFELGSRRDLAAKRAVVSYLAPEGQAVPGWSGPGVSACG